MPEWISVKERLPEKSGRYLVRYKRDIVLDYTEVHDMFSSLAPSDWPDWPDPAEGGGEDG